MYGEVPRRAAGEYPLGFDRVLRDLLDEGAGIYLEIECGTGVHASRVRDLGLCTSASTPASVADSPTATTSMRR